ncbi:hypothetical protein FRX31_016181 [Thalictrum thalictroides]|uniref:Uncharacterized protein n=1 Tax=Thalictrum thalictroides TaxID=46969 RepID=A0A7J6WB99_THATH|nr:hypothetical protein FRX31_016181 [Thalictrum thalictroides]
MHRAAALAAPGSSSSDFRAAVPKRQQAVSGSSAQKAAGSIGQQHTGQLHRAAVVAPCSSTKQHLVAKLTKMGTRQQVIGIGNEQRGIIGELLVLNNKQRFLFIVLTK